MKPIEYLSMYLPYRIQIKWDSGVVETMEAIDITKIDVTDSFKPILKPLESITEEGFKEIAKENGGTLIFFHINNNVLEWALNKRYSKYINRNEGFVNFYMPPNRTRFRNDMSGDDIPVWLFMSLIKRHYDVFGLIQQGKAVNYYELNKEV